MMKKETKKTYNQIKRRRMEVFTFIKSRKILVYKRAKILVKLTNIHCAIAKKVQLTTKITTIILTTLHAEHYLCATSPQL
jgi:hypothetical protein